MPVRLRMGGRRFGNDERRFDSVVGHWEPKARVIPAIRGKEFKHGRTVRRGENQMTIQDTIAATLAKLEIPSKQIQVYGRQIVITCWSLEAAIVSRRP